MALPSKSSNPEIASLQTHVQAAQEEFDWAVICHEVWKPAVYDKSLHQRMGVSYATNTFRVLVTALRREVLLALVRLWDTRREAVRMEEISKALSDDRIISVLAAERASRFHDVHIEAEMKMDMKRQAGEAIDLIQTYCRNGRRQAVLEKLRTVRHKRLAHRQIEPTAVTGPDLTDEEIETFYQDNSKIIKLLLSVVAGVHYIPEETGQVFAHHASYFWNAVRGERTEGHPDYRPPPKIVSA